MSKGLITLAIASLAALAAPMWPSVAHSASKQGKPIPGGSGKFSVSKWRVPNKAYVEWTTTYTGGGPGVTYRYSTFCTNSCQGGKHFTHEQCDDSCDTVCGTLHSAALTPVIDNKNGATAALAKAIDAGLKQMGIQQGVAAGPLPKVNGGNIAAQIKKEARPKAKDHTERWKAGHWNTKPCSATRKGFAYNRYQVRVDWQLVRVDMNTGKPIRVLGPKGSTVMWQLEKADPTPQNPAFGTLTQCKCNIVKGGLKYKDGDLYHEGTMGIGDTKVGSTGGVFLDKGGDGYYAFADTGSLNEVGFQINFEDMNKFNASVSSKTMNIRIMPGTEYVPEDDSYQRMCSTTQAVFAGFLANVNPRPDDLVTARANCLEIDKKEPEPGVKYTWRVPTDSRIVQLAHFVSQQRFRGPWDQARTWIYTDAASPEKVNERLFPSISPSRYVRATHDIFRVTAFPFEDKRYDACFSADQLSDELHDPEALGWYAAETAQRHVRPMADWLKKSGAQALQNMAAEGTEAPAALIEACLETDKDRVREAMMEALTKTSAATLKALAEAGALDAAFSEAMSEDRRRAEAGVALAEKAMHPAAMIALLSVAEKHPDALRNRAGELSVKLEGQS